MLNPVNSFLPMFTRLPMLTTVNFGMFTYVYPCLLVITYEYDC